MGDHIYRNYDNMDVLFYEQQTPSQPSGNNFNKYDKSAMRLNLRPPQLTGQENHRPINRKSSNGLFHHSPEMGIFKIVSPELERFIGNNTGLTPRGNPAPSSPEFPLFSLVSPEFEKILASLQNKTPTPTRVLREGNSVAKEREVYVQGFAEALQHIHDQQHTHLEHGNSDHMKVQQQLAIPGTVHTAHLSYGWTDRSHDSHPSYESITRESVCDMEAMHYVSNIEQPEDSEMSANSSFNQNERMSEQDTYKLEDTSLRAHGMNGVLPLPPIDLELQEIVKRERKKQKNRVAASKCRRKKLEREAQLEVRVQHLKEKNIELNAVASALRQQVGELKQRVLEHVAFGCQLPTVTNAAY